MSKLSDLGFIENTGLGIYPYPEFEAVPQLNFNNFSVGNNAVRSQPNNTWHAAENFSKVWGRHSMKFGGEFRYLQVNDRNISSAVNGVFSFNGSETGSDFADFLLGAPSGYVQSSIQALDSRTRYGAVFVQDSFRVKSNLTLNYGLRWEASMPWYDTQGKIETLVPGVQSTVFPTAPKGWLVPGDPGIPSTLAPTDYKEFSPRLGIAYSPSQSGRIPWQAAGRSREIEYPRGLRHLLHGDRRSHAVRHRRRCALWPVLGRAAAGVDAGAVPDALRRQFARRPLPVHLPDSGKPRQQDPGLFDLPADRRLARLLVEEPAALLGALQFDPAARPGPVHGR